jgi:NitT/TauT family transport system substrate-binding protein
MPRHQFCRGLATCLIIAAAFFALPPESGNAAEQRAVRFRMEWVPSGMYAPYFFAQDSGIYAKHGLDVEILNGNGSLTAIEEVNSSHADFALSSCGALALAISKGRNVVSIGQYTAKYSWGFYVGADSPIKSIGDLRGKSVVMSPNSSEALLLPAVFEIAGLKPDDVRKVSVDPSQKISTYARGQGDSMVTTVAYGDPLVQEARASRVLLWADVGFVMPDYCLVARTETVEKEPKLVASFLAATFSAIEAADAKPDAAIDAALKMRPILQRPATAKQWDLTRQFLRSANTQGCQLGWHSPKDWQAGLAILKKYSGLEGDIDAPNRFYTNQFSKC